MNSSNPLPGSNLPVVSDDMRHGQMTVHDPYANGYIPEDEIDLREIWKVITKHKGIIFSILFLVLITTIIATLLMRPVYRAEALIEIKSDRSSVVKFDSIEQADYQPAEYKTTQQNIITSNSVAEAVISKLRLEDDPEINGELAQRGIRAGIKDVLRNFTEKEDSGNSEPIDTSILYIKRFKERLNVTSIRKSDLFNVSFDSFDPKQAARIANTTIDEYMRLDRKKRLDSNAGAKQFLSSEIASIQAKLEASEKDLTQFARSNNIIDVEEKGNIMNQRLADLNAQLTVVTGERVAAEAIWMQAQTGGAQSLPSVLSSGLINDLKKEKSRLQSEYLNKSKIYKPAYPALQQLKAELDTVSANIYSEVERLSGGLRTNFDQLKSKEILLSAKVEEQKQALLGIKDKSIQYNILKREWESNKELYTGLLEKMKEVGVAGGMEPNSIALIDAARAPLSQFKPDLMLNSALAGVLGLMAGIGVAFLLSFLDNTIRTPDDLEKVVALASLGLIPTEKNKAKAEAKAKKRNNKFELGKASNIARYESLLEFRAHFERRSDIAEAFRSIRTSLMFSSPTGLPKTIQVTSTAPGEGKTTIATNLALVLADNGAKVLLVDADLRKHRLHKVFGVPSAPGLSETIVSGISDTSIIKIDIDNLFFLPAGTTPPNPAELLGSSGLDKFLAEVSDDYDHIILDSAPLLGLADSVVLSTKVEGIIYTVHAGMVNKDHLREGVKRLRRVRAPLLGAILNNVDMNSKEYGYYGQYYYSYQSDDENQQHQS